MSLEGRCRAVWVVIFETGRVLGFAMFEGGRAINDGAIHAELLKPNVRLEPTPSCEHRILSPARLPSPWHWKQVAVVLKVCESKARTSPPWCFRIVAAWG
jgi:hypothetical protein